MHGKSFQCQECIQAQNALTATKSTTKVACMKNDKKSFKDIVSLPELEDELDAVVRKEYLV